MSIQTLVKTELSGMEQRQVTIRAIAGVLIKKFQRHIGHENCIPHEDLFRELFKHEYKDTNLADVIRWDFTKKAMHYLRKYTHCFIVSQHEQDGFVFWVAKTDADAQVYIRRLDRSIAAMRYMQRKVQTSVMEHWYKESWTLPSPTVKRIR